jgi:hypothetical protein
MPIEIDEFNSGKVDLQIQKEILDYLRENRTKAFTIKEIIEGIGHPRSSEDLPLLLMQSIGYSTVLGQLIKDRRIKSKVIDYKNYYMIQ